MTNKNLQQQSKIIRELNDENETKSRLINVISIILMCTVIGPLTFTVLLNADWIDALFSNAYAQLGFIFLLLAIISYLYLRWRISK